MWKNKLVLRNIRTLGHTTPPSHFTSGDLPPNFDQLDKSFPKETSSPIVTPNQSHQSGNNGDKPLRELTSMIAMFTLGYIAIDNYINRIKLEKINSESTSINLKTLQIQQANFTQAREKRDLQILMERKDNQKKAFKMQLHIAMLRQQLAKNGIDPVDIDDALDEFDKSVKLSNSIRNISGQNLWLNDDSELKNYLPDIHDYDKKTK